MLGESNVTMIYAHGFVFVGKVIGNELKDALQMIPVMGQNDRGEFLPTNVPIKAGDIQFSDIKQYPQRKVAEKSQLHRDYISITTGLELPGQANAHKH